MRTLSLFAYLELDVIILLTFTKAGRPAGKMFMFLISS